MKLTKTKVKIILCKNNSKKNLEEIKDKKFKIKMIIINKT